MTMIKDIRHLERLGRLLRGESIPECVDILHLVAGVSEVMLFLEPIANVTFKYKGGRYILGNSNYVGMSSDIVNIGDDIVLGWL